MVKNKGIGQLYAKVHHFGKDSASTANRMQHVTGHVMGSASKAAEVGPKCKTNAAGRDSSINLLTNLKFPKAHRHSRNQLIQKRGKRYASKLQVQNESETE